MCQGHLKFYVKPLLSHKDLVGSNSFGQIALYSIEDDELIVYIVKVGHRKDIDR